MNRNLVLGVLAIVLLVGVGGYYYFGKESVVVAPEYPIKKHFKWRYKLTNTSDQMLENVIFTTQIPLEKSSFQIREKLKASLPYKSETTAFGDTVIFTIPTLSPYQSKFIDLKSNMAFNVVSQTANNNESLEKYLLTTNLIQVDSPEISGLAKKLIGNNDKKTASNIYHWIKNNLKYSGYIKKDLGALYALEQKKGDCTEYAMLMAALARASGIPTKVISGFVYQNSSVIKAEDLHNWVEVYIDGKWQIIDPQKERFMEKEHEYLAFMIYDGSGKNIPISKVFSPNVSIGL